MEAKKASSVCIAPTAHTVLNAYCGAMRGRLQIQLFPACAVHEHQRMPVAHLTTRLHRQSPPSKTLEFLLREKDHTMLHHATRVCAGSQQLQHMYLSSSAYGTCSRGNVHYTGAGKCGLEGRNERNENVSEFSRGVEGGYIGVRDMLFGHPWVGYASEREQVADASRAKSARSLISDAEHTN